MFICLNGKFVTESEAKVSVFDHGFLYGDGIYETFRTFGGEVWALNEHLERLQRSAGKIMIDMPYSKEAVGRWVYRLVKENGFKESRIRITLTRGCNDFDFGKSKKPTLVIQATLLKEEPKAFYERGVDLITFKGERFLPEIKSISLLPLATARRELKGSKAYEAIFVDEKGFVREGTITNVFIIKSGVLLTPNSRVLPGTMRDMVMRLAREIGIRARTADFTARKLFVADEVFITNSLRGIMPVRAVDGRKIGTGMSWAGKPGPDTKKLMQALHEFIQKTSV
ncbi:aminotransferase class IV [Patescibacteria group bacterium]|nr:aminotransferase class IV [Patescibacteria group bacterium]MBU1703391.1 aminotransferase class IV [Patescibacteria group bacterium]MBU1953905.1 aminotransferase class IV [Patescibacteria group bacterium]